MQGYPPQSMNPMIMVRSSLSIVDKTDICYVAHLSLSDLPDMTDGESDEDIPAVKRICSGSRSNVCGAYPPFW